MSMKTMPFERYCWLHTMASKSESTYSLPIVEIVDRVVTLNEQLRDFWSNASGWAPILASDLLSRSRLDWQVSLSRSLVRWVDTPNDQDLAATLILGYTNLGSLVEGSMKLFLSVYYVDYKDDADAIIRRGDVVAPDVATLELLKQFFEKRIWDASLNDKWSPWIQRIQSRRNAIHASRDREIGLHQDLVTDIRHYLVFLRRINNQLPYPDGGGWPSESKGVLSDACESETDAPEI